MSQSDLSKNLGISASYLNLIESGRRTITVPLLIKIGNELSLSLKDLTIESNKRLLSDVMEVLSNELFEDLDIQIMIQQNLLATIQILLKLC